MQKNYYKAVRNILFIIDIVILILSFFFAHIIRLNSLYLSQTYLTLLLFSILGWIVLSYFLNIYNHNRKYQLIDEIFSLTKLIITFFAFTSIIAFFYKSGNYSRLVLFVFSLLLLAFSILDRIIIYLLIKRKRKSNNKKNVLIIGAGRVGQRIFEEITNNSEYNYNFIGFLDDRPKKNKPQDKIIGKINDIKTILKEKNIQELFIALPLNFATETYLSILDIAEFQGVKLMLIPDFSRIFQYGVKLSKMGSLPIITFIEVPLDYPINRIIKRIFDIVFSSFVILLGSPVFLFSALLVKISSKGPVFFIQKRTGTIQKTFKCIKFRTMRESSQEIADSLQATEDDPRKTKIGEFLRKTNLDEIPQFFNVLKGEMSVVGPRPHMLKHTDEFRVKVRRYMCRHFVKPGITGWAQVNGWRGPTDTQEKIEKRVEHDIWYIENWTFSLDIKIIFKTVFSKQSHLNAY